MADRPNVLVILTDQLRQPPPYESDELREFRREHCVGQERLRQNGVSFKHHYPMAIACAPSLAADRAVPVTARRDADRWAGEER
jgi:arylsulfatase A-like enzyme